MATKTTITVSAKARAAFQAMQAETPVLTLSDKVTIIDGETILTGSFNFTKAAQDRNAENLLIIHDPTLAAQSTKNWDAHRQHSQPYVGRGVAR